MNPVCWFECNSIELLVNENDGGFFPVVDQIFFKPGQLTFWNVNVAPVEVPVVVWRPIHHKIGIEHDEMKTSTVECVVIPGFSKAMIGDGI